MTCNRHAYYRRHPRGFANEYALRIQPESMDPPQPTHARSDDPNVNPWRRITRNEARQAAAWTNPKGIANVTIQLCPQCGTAASIQQHANKRPHGTIAQRLKLAQQTPPNEEPQP